MPVSEKQKEKQRQYYRKNRDAILERQRRRYHENDGSAYSKYNVEARANHRLKTRYGISLEKYNHIFAQQGGRCAICLNSKSGGKGWNVDHDHSCCPGRRSCGKCVRGILCHACNVMIGFAKEDIETLRRASEYILRDRNLLNG